MHIDSIRYYVEIVNEKSISRVANKTHISQSALSQIIQKLEDDLGYKLLIRSNKGVFPTKMGEIVYKYSNNIIKNHQKMLQELDSYEMDHNQFKINGSWSLVAYSLPCVIYKIKKKFPEYNFELVASNFEQTINDIQNDLCDVGFVDEEPDKKYNFFSYKMGREKVVLIAASHYQLPDNIFLEDLLTYELIHCTVNVQTSKQLDNELKKINKSIKDLKILFNVDSISAVKSAVLNGNGMAFVPYEVIKHELYEKTVKIIDIVGVNLDYDIYLISKKLSELSKASKEAIDYLIEYGRKSFC